jgi:hypothetical protein
MLSCDYNGWTDAPEDEREELERFSEFVRPDAELGCRAGRNAFSAAAVLTTERAVRRLPGGGEFTPGPGR